MKIKTAEFIVSNTDYRLCPKDSLAEYAFIGRSNVGKSSLINAITNQKELAKTSGKPGKTQLINHFKINNNWFLVDLPGYGYAKASKKKRESFKILSEEYLMNSIQLRCVFVLIDLRIKPQISDINFMNWLGKNNLPFIRLFSKIDKLNNEKIKKAIEKQNIELLNYWEATPPYMLLSSKKKIGKEDILNKIEKLNNLE